MMPKKTEEEKKETRRRYLKKYNLLNKGKLKERALRWARENPEKRRAYKLKARYGLTTAEFNNMKAYQRGKCVICLREQTLVVDHSHQTGIVRGLLCGPCNKGLGNFRDDRDALLMAADYIASRVLL